MILIYVTATSDMLGRTDYSSWRSIYGELAEGDACACDIKKRTLLGQRSDTFASAAKVSKKAMIERCAFKVLFIPVSLQPV